MNTATIWNNYHAQLHAFIRRRVGEDAAADDILQEVFLRTHRRLGELKEETKLQSWLYQIARNAIIDHYRSRSMATAELDELPEEVSDSGARAVQELAQCLRPMIESLPQSYRDALIMSELEGLTQREIAEHEGISLSGAKSRVQRARMMLKERLDECCRFEFDQRGHLVSYAPHHCADDCDTVG